MLLVNETRAVALLKDAGYPVERKEGHIIIGLFTFRWARIIHGTRMFSQDAIVAFVKE